jgi:hypothetical protein
MTGRLQFLRSPTGQLMVVGILAAVAVAWTAWQRLQQPRPMPSANRSVATPASLPKVFQRPGARLEVPKAPEAPTVAGSASHPPKPAAPAVLPLALSTIPTTATHSKPVGVPYGRLIPCETVVALESNRLDTPVIGLVTENVFAGGKCIVPAGTEVHGRAALDRVRERLAVSGPWVLVWREPGPGVGRELRVQGIALDRDRAASPGNALASLAHDGSAGLRGEIIRADDFREAKLFAATFLSSATAALQDTRTSSGVLGDSLVPAATARNAALAGSSAILREYARELREAITRDGFYLRIPAGTAFYLYVTEPISFHETR